MNAPTLCERAAQHEYNTIPGPENACRTRREINEAVNEVCTCGGSGPGEGCPACNVWHILFTPNGYALMREALAKKRKDRS